MGRRAKSDGESISLFPFLSIIACVIGTLTLIITVISIGQIDAGESKETKVVNDQYEQVIEELKELKVDEEELKKLLEDSKSLEDKLAAALAETEKLKEEEKKKKSDKTKKEKVNIDLLAQANKLRERVKELKADTTDRKKEIKDLNAEIAKLKSPPKAANVVIQAGGSGLNLDPYFVECTKNGVRLLDNKNKPFVTTADLNKKEGVFHKLLDSVAKKTNGTVILLLRPDAVNTYNRAKSAARSHYSKGSDGKYKYCPIGKLPVSTQGIIDLSIFRKK